MDAADLDVEFVGDGFKVSHIFGELGKLDVNGSSHGSAQVSGAGGDVTEVLIVGKLDNSLDVGGSAGESVEDCMDVGTLLHGDDA